MNDESLLKQALEALENLDSMQPSPNYYPDEHMHARESIAALRDRLAQPTSDPQAMGSETRKLWLWRNHVDGRPEYWAFDNPFPTHDNGDPQTLGEPCGYALLKPSRNGRPDVPEEAVMQRIKPVAAVKDSLTPEQEPPTRTPLTDKQMDQLVYDCGLSATARDIARAIERAHGIGEGK